MFVVPLLSILVTLFINQFSYIWASVIGGVVYFLHTPAIIIWHQKFEKKSENFEGA